MNKSWWLLTALGTLAACQAPAPVDQALDTLADEHLTYMRQQAARLSTELGTLTRDGAAYCRDELTLDALQDQWRHSFAAWTAHQGQSGSPLDAAGLGFAFQLWPDKKDTTGRQLAQRLARPGPLKGAVITLGAMEYLLYEDLTPPQRCALLPEVSRRLEQSGEQLLAAWQDPRGYAEQLEQMATQGGDTALLTQILGQLAHRYDRIEKKLVLPLNTAAHPRPLFAEAWRSGQSLYFLRTSLDSLAQEYRDGGIRAYLQQKNHTTLIDELDGAFTDTLAHLPAGDSLAPWLEGDNYAALLRFKLSLDQLGYRLRQRLPGELGLSLGFNATDGD